MLCCALLLGKAQQVDWLEWLLSPSGNLRMGMPLSSPPEDERGFVSPASSSASVSHWLKFPIGPSVPSGFTLLHSWVASCKILVTAWGTIPYGALFLPSPEMSRKARDSGYVADRLGQQNCMSSHGVSWLPWWLGLSK